ncbi:SAC3 family protein B isoform X1 [Hordeum vulgare subsp. vulgare]|uniref:PCI domain-containing protein n=2 Tax=Hordeum vulgare subsp. vulgare TaxID=112509 RepID=A0A8I6WL97_HORVV|nr:SAC3 family protein B isoform X1 [Hordeum vulgare subsp. vulgare]
MEASGFGRDAGPLNRGPGSAPLAFGAGAATAPSPAPQPAPVQFPSARPAAPFVSPSSRFPSARPQLAAAAPISRPTSPVPIPASSARPAAAAPGAPGPVRFPSPLRAVDPGAAAATARHAARHLQSQPRVAASSIGRPMHPGISSRSRSPPNLSNQRVDVPPENDNGMGQRRLVNYADPLFENGSVQSSVQMRMQPPETGKTARSPPLDISRQFRPSSSLPKSPPMQRAEPHDHVEMPNLSPSKFGIQNQSPFPDAHASFSPLLNSNLVRGSGRLRPASGTSTSSSVLGDAAQQEMNDHMREQRFSAPLQSRMDHSISKRSRSPTLSYQDVDGAEARHGTGANARRLINYADTLVDDVSIETSKRMRAPSSEFTNMPRSPPSDIRDNIRPAPAGFGSSNVAAQNLRSQADIQRSKASLPMVGSQTKSRIGDARSPPYQQFRPSDTYSEEYSTPTFSPPKPSIPNSRSVTPPLDDGDDVIPSTELEREKQAKAKRLARFNVELSRPVENINDLAKADKQKQASSMGKVPARSNDTTMADMDPPELAAILGLCSYMCPEPERAERERKGDLDRYERLDGDRNQTTELLAVKKYTRTAERDADLIRPLPVLQKTMSYLLSLLDHTYDDSFLGLYNFLWDRMRAIRMDLRMQHFYNQEAISMLEQMIRLHIVAMHELCEYSKGEGFSEGFDAHLNIEQMNKTSVELFQMYEDHRRNGVLFSTEQEFRGYYALLKLDKHPGYKVEPSELSLDLAKMSRKIRGSPDVLFAREVARACRMGNYIAFFRLARKATYLQACLMHAHFAKVRRQALASLHSGLQIGQGIPISHVVEWLAMEDEDIESLLEYHGFGSRQYEGPYLVKEGPFLNSENDFPSGCSELVHSKKSQRIVDDVSFGPVSAPTGQKATVAPYSGRFPSPASKRELIPPRSALVIPVSAKKEFGPSSSGPVSPTSSRQITSPYSGPFSPKAGNKQFNSTYSSPISPTGSRKGSVPVIPSTSPRATKHTLSHTGWMDDQRVASPKAKGKTTITDDFIISEDQNADCVDFSREQTEIPQSESYTPHVDALVATIVSHPLADGVSSDYAHMHEEEDELRAHGSGSDTDLADESPSCHQVNLIEHVWPTGSLLPDYEYGDHQINNETTDDSLPIVVSPKKTISDERLKMILRKWRQRAADQRSLREQKNALAIAALNSLSLGPPVHQTAVVPKHAVHELDIGHAFKERYTRQRRSWSRLNVSELSGPILTERKPDARCICWKMLVVVPPGAMKSQSNNVASKWLLKKLMGSGNEDNGLLYTSADLSIWRTWLSSPSVCCLSVVRASDQQVIGNDIADSTNCIVFVVSESIPWEMQKARFSSLLASIPPQSSLPLLILSGDTYNEGYDYVSQNVIDKLGVSGPSEGKIASSLVVFLAGSCTEGCSNGFFDDGKLREGLKWMASSFPLQPDVILVKTHELVLNYLNPSLELLNQRVAPEVGPEHCISVFNNAVNHLGEEILAAAYRSPNQWPALEIDLLERSSSERMFTEMFLPSVGWSLPSRIQPLVEAVKSLQLPEFSDGLSWLKQGSYMGRQIQDQKLYLEECLTRYLTQSAQLLNGAQAVAEAKIMVQKGVDLELRDSNHYLVPNWVTIFRRIYNWRLARLSTGDFSEAYVLSQRLYQPPAADSNGATQHGLTANSDSPDKAPILEDHDMMPAVLSGLSLDEIIEASCDLDSDSPPPPRPTPAPLPTPVCDEPPQAPAHINGEVNLVHGATGDNQHFVPRRLDPRRLVPPAWDDELAKLEQQCAKLQSKIDERLFIYF